MKRIDLAGTEAAQALNLKRNGDRWDFPYCGTKTAQGVALTLQRIADETNETRGRPTRQDLLSALKDAGDVLVDLLNNHPAFFPNRGIKANLTPEECIWRDRVAEARQQIRIIQGQDGSLDDPDAPDAPADGEPESSESA